MIELQKGQVARIADNGQTERYVGSIEEFNGLEVQVLGRVEDDCALYDEIAYHVTLCSTEPSEAITVLASDLKF